MEDNIKKLKELEYRTYKFNVDAEKALVKAVNDVGGVILTDQVHNEDKDVLYGYVFDEELGTIREVYIIAVFTYKDELYIQIAYADYIYIDNKIDVNIESEDAYLVKGDMVLMNATYHNLCEILPEYLKEDKVNDKK
jgi:hypothetical protein